MHPNRITGSKVTAILLNGWILPTGGASLGRVCAWSLHSRLVLHVLYSLIRTTWNSNNNKDLSPWIGEQPIMQMDFWQFSSINTYVRICGKFSEIHLHAWLFYNPLGKVLFSFFKIIGHICCLHLILLDWIATKHTNEFLTIFQECWHMCYSWKIVRNIYAYIEKILIIFMQTYFCIPFIL